MEEKIENIDVEPKPKPSLLGMIGSPVEQFEKIRNRPIIWLPMLIVTLFTVIGTLLSFMSMDLAKCSRRRYRGRRACSS